MNVFKENPDWKAIEKLNKEKGFVENEYYYKNAKCHKVKLDSIKIKHYEGYLLIYRDIRNINSWLKLLNKYLHEIYGENLPKLPSIRIKGKEDVYDIIKSLFVSSVTAYGKLFVKAEGRSVKLEKQIFENNSKLLAIHEIIMKYRHNFSAHSGNIKIEGVFVYLLIDSVKDRGTSPIIVREIYQPDCPELNEIMNFEKIVQYLMVKLDKKNRELHDKIYNNILEKGKEFWYSIID